MNCESPKPAVPRGELVRKVTCVQCRGWGRREWGNAMGDGFTMITCPQCSGLGYRLERP